MSVPLALAPARGFHSLHAAVGEKEEGGGRVGRREEGVHVLVLAAHTFRTDW